MEIVSPILVFSGILTALIASISLLVIAFRVSVGWFIVCFLPFGKLVFSVVHWSQARRAVLAYYVGIAMMFTGFAVHPKAGEDNDNPLHAIGRIFRPETKKGAPVRWVPDQTLAKREERITVLQAQLAKDTADLSAAFRELSTRRAALKPGDEKALAAYNSEAARYATLLESTRRARTELDSLMASLDH